MEGIPANVTDPKPRAAEIVARLPDGPCVGAEVGVLTGALSAELLARKADLTLYMVDAWGMKTAAGLTAWNDRASKQVAADGMKYLAAALEATAFAAHHRCLLVGDSANGFAAVAPGSLDFVYLDAGHSYEAVRLDLAAWEKAVKPGGLLCGHDYVGEVKRAVDEYATARGLRVTTGVCLNWYLD